MSYQLFHKYKLTISKPPTINKTPVTVTSSEGKSDIIQGASDNRSVDPLKAIVITELQMTASITATKEGTGSQTSIKVLGLGDDSLSYIQADSVVLLEGGWEENAKMPLLFVGQVVTASVDTESNTSSVVIACKEGYTPASMKISKEYPEGVNYKEILEDLADIYADNGIPVGRPLDKLESLQGVGVDSPADQIIAADGYSVSGFLDTVLAKVCKEVGFTYYFSSSKLYIEPKDYSQTVDALVLPASSVLSAKKVVNNTNSTSKDSQDPKQGWKVKAFLDGRLEVGGFIQLDVPDVIQGSFKIIKITHDLDYEGDSWFSTMELQDV